MSNLDRNIKKILFLSFFIIFFNSFTVYTCDQQMYEDYLSYWSRNLTLQKRNPDFTDRFLQYCQNKKRVDQVNSQNLSYTLNQYSRWMDKTEQQKKEQIRVQFSLENLAAISVQAIDNSELRKVSSVPNSVDYRLTNHVSSIKDQGSCGCCWSFTTVGLYQSWMMLRGQLQYDLSQQYLLQCTTKFTKNVKKQNYNSGCQGGYIDFSGQLARINGIPLQSKFPYISASFTGQGYPTTPNICQANQTIMYARNPNVTAFIKNTNVSHANMKILISNAPAAALIYANSDFQNYRSGVFTGCSSSFWSPSSNLNHAVVIVGYDSNGNYIIKNSWGTSWGQNGFGVVSKDSDCGLSTYVYQYSTNAPPGNGVIFNGQINLGESFQEYLRLCGILMSLLAMLALF